MVRKHNCPYLSNSNQSEICNLKLAPHECKVNDPSKCPFLKESKAWEALGMFFKEKGPQPPLNQELEVSDK